MPEVRIRSLSKRFGDVVVLHDVDLTVHDGEFFTLLGPSGCGKSTTLNCIAGLEDPTAGSITVGEEVFVDADHRYSVPPEGRNLGMVFQSYALWPHMTIRQNLAMPLSIRRVPRTEKASRIFEALDKVGLGHLQDRYPHQLSGGQQQRVALARALVYSPSVLLLDEPLSNLDAKLREQARAWLKRLQEELGITTVYVTHDQDEALSLSDRIAVMFDGHMAQVGTPTQIYETPSDARVAGFVGSCNFLVGTVEECENGVATVALAGSRTRVRVVTTQRLLPGSDAIVAIRPEHLRPLAAGDAADVNVLEAEVVTRAYVGSRYEYLMRSGGTAIQAVSRDPVLHGSIRFTFAPSDARAFPGRDVPTTTDAREMAVVSG